MTLFWCALFLAWAPPSAGQAAYERANALFVARQFDAASAAVEEALRLDARLVPAWTLKAKMALAANRHDVARECLKRALAVDPKAPYAQFLYGLEAYLTNDMKEALVRFRQARQLAPRDARAALYLGLATESLGETAEALALYRQAVRLDRETGRPAAETLLPGVRLLALLGRAEEAEDWVRQALRLAPRSRDAHFELARLLLKKGAAAEAAVEGEAALGLAAESTTDTAIRYLLIQAYRRLGQLERAAEHTAVMRAQEAAVIARD